MWIDFQIQWNEAIPRYECATWAGVGSRHGGFSMKAMLLAFAVIVVVIGVFAYIVHTDANRAQTRAAIDVLHEESPGLPKDPEALGYLDLKNHNQRGFNHDFSVEQAMKETQSWIVRGALLRQDYLLRQTEYKLAQIRSVVGNTTSKELEERRAAYADATKRFQTFWDIEVPSN